MSSKQFPVIPDTLSLEPHPTSIPWEIADLAYSAYMRKYGKKQPLERIAERGGFYASELDSLLPGWRYMRPSPLLNEFSDWLESNYPQRSSFPLDGYEYYAASVAKFNATQEVLDAFLESREAVK